MGDFLQTLTPGRSLCTDGGMDSSSSLCSTLLEAHVHQRAFVCLSFCSRMILLLNEVFLLGRKTKFLFAIISDFILG